jgi:hypothetical protein
MSAPPTDDTARQLAEAKQLLTAAETTLAAHDAAPPITRGSDRETWFARRRDLSSDVARLTHLAHHAQEQHEAAIAAQRAAVIASVRQRYHALMQRFVPEREAGYTVLADARAAYEATAASALVEARQVWDQVLEVRGRLMELGAFNQAADMLDEEKINGYGHVWR